MPLNPLANGPRSVECRRWCPGRDDARDRDAKAGAEEREGLLLPDQAGDVAVSAWETDSHSVTKPEGAVVPPLNFHRADRQLRPLRKLLRHKGANQRRSDLFGSGSHRASLVDDRRPLASHRQTIDSGAYRSAPIPLR